MKWEVEAAHIVPHSYNGKDDVWNGIALCHLHHWAFDVGWFSLKDNFQIITPSKLQKLTKDYGMMFNYNFIEHLINQNLVLSLPKNENNHPHLTAIQWHRDNIFYK